MVTICGTGVMIALPLLQGPLALTETQLGAWARASVPEVGQRLAETHSLVGWQRELKEAGRRLQQGSLRAREDVRDGRWPSRSRPLWIFASR